MKVIAVLNYFPQFQFPSHAKLHNNLKFRLEYHVLIVCEKAPHITSYITYRFWQTAMFQMKCVIMPIFHKGLCIQNGFHFCELLKNLRTG